MTAGEFSSFLRFLFKVETWSALHGMPKSLTENTEFHGFKNERVEFGAHLTTRNWGGGI